MARRRMQSPDQHLVLTTCLHSFESHITLREEFTQRIYYSPMDDERKKFDVETQKGYIASVADKMTAMRLLADRFSVTCSLPSMEWD
jgi:hypothetical protein